MHTCSSLSNGVDVNGRYHGVKFNQSVLVDDTWVVMACNHSAVVFDYNMLGMMNRVVWTTNGNSYVFNNSSDDRSVYMHLE
jgi:hypothetical protein